MDIEGARILRRQFVAGMDQAQDKIELLKQYRPNDGGEIAQGIDESIKFELVLIANYTGSIAFIDRHMPAARE